MSVSKMDERISGAGYVAKEPAVVPHARGDGPGKPVLKSSKKVRAPSLPPSVAAPSVFDQSSDQRTRGQVSTAPQKTVGAEVWREASQPLVISQTQASVQENLPLTRESSRQTEVSRSPASAPVSAITASPGDHTESEHPQRPPRGKKHSETRYKDKSEHPSSLKSDSLSSFHLVEIQTSTSEDTSKISPRQPPTTTSNTKKVSQKSKSHKSRPAPLPNQTQVTRDATLTQEVLLVGSEDNILTTASVMPSKVSSACLQPKYLTGHTEDAESHAQDTSLDSPLPPPLPSTAPPPLPSSAPPLLPSGEFSAVQDNITDAAEEVTIEYTVPVKFTSPDSVVNVATTSTASHNLSSSEVGGSYLSKNSSTSTNTTQAFSDIHGSPKLQSESRAEYNQPVDVQRFGYMQGFSSGVDSSRFAVHCDTSGEALNDPPETTRVDVGLAMRHKHQVLKPSSSNETDTDISIDSDVSNDDGSVAGRGGNYDLILTGDGDRTPGSLAPGLDGDAHGSSTTDDGVMLISNTRGLKNYSNTDITMSSHAPTSETSPRSSIQATIPVAVSSKIPNTTREGHSLSKATTAISSSSLSETFPPAPDKSQQDQRDGSAVKITTHEPSKKRPAPPGAVEMPDHQELLASTAAVIRSQKSATPRETSPQKLKQPRSPTSPTSPTGGSAGAAAVASEQILKPVGSLALFAPAPPSPSEDTDRLSGLKVTKGSELVAKARHFAEMTEAKPPNFVVRKANSGGGEGEDQSKPADSGGQSVVKRNGTVRHSADDSLESDHSSGRSKSSNPSEYGYIYSAERPKPPPEVGWKDRPEGESAPVSLYSENVVKEGDTTETVDRESIANLTSTKKQWENIFSSSLSPTSGTPEATSVKKRGQPKWEVRLPYKEKHPAPASAQQLSSQGSSPTYSDTSGSQTSSTTMSSSGNLDSESAIEREIRLAHEREEMLKLEQAERLKLQQQQQQQPGVGQGHSIIASYEASSAESESYTPAFDELTEADRGPDLWAQGRGRDRHEQQEDSKSSEQVNPNESIIEREIRLQQERENEIASMRQQSSGLTPRPAPEQPQSAVHEEEEDAVPSSPSQYDKENLIALELRQLQEREEEIRRIHSALPGTQSSPQDPVHDQTAQSLSHTPAQSTPSSLAIANQQQTPRQQPAGNSPSWQKDVSPFVTAQASGMRRSSADSASSHSTGGRTPSDYTPSRSVRVQPLMMDPNEEDEKPNYFVKQETPIEREMRIARERENDLRRQKGLPEIVAKEDDYYSSYGHSSDQSNGNSDLKSSGGGGTSRSRSASEGKPGSMTPRSSGSDPMKRFASNRLQQELMQQKERELALRNEGKIISTSEEHIQPLKYTEVAGVDWVDGKEKRNFVTASSKRSPMATTPEAESPSQESDASPSANVAVSRKTKSVGAGGQLFSYKEFKQTAESKIERELREMREREEELKMLRVSKSQSPQQ